MIEEIGIIDTRKIISTIKETCGVDFSDYALTSLRRRFYGALESNKITNVDVLLNLLRTDSEFLEKFIFDISVDSTELFRDPKAWQQIRKLIFPKIASSKDIFKIWFPDANSGEEVYSLSILLEEENLLDKVKIYASNISKLKTEFMQKGLYKPKREDSNTENYIQLKGKYTFDKYYTMEGVCTKMRSDLLKKVEYINSKSITENAPSDINLVIFRNSMIYVNRTYQNVLVDAISKNMLVGGYFVIGIQETLNGLMAEKKFKVIDESERIFQKVIA